MGPPSALSKTEAVLLIGCPLMCPQMVADQDLQRSQSFTYLSHSNLQVCRLETLSAAQTLTARILQLCIILPVGSGPQALLLLARLKPNMQHALLYWAC